MGDELSPNGNQDFAGANARYEQAFRDYGTDLSRLTTEQGAELLRNLGGRSNVDLAAAIDDWAYARTLQGDIDATRNPLTPKSLLGITQLLDPDATRNRVRAAIIGRDAESLSRIAAEIDPAAHPSQTINLIPVWLFWMKLPHDRKAAAAEADVFLTRALPHHWGNFQITHNLAFYRNLLGRNSESLQFSVAAVALRPNSSAAWQDYARSLDATGHPAEAAAAYRRIAELSPRAWSQHLNAAEIHESLGREADAVADYRRAALAAGRSGLGSDAYSMSVMTDEVLKKWRQYGLLDALAEGMRDAMAREPENVTQRISYGKLLQKLGLAEEAKPHFEAAIAILQKQTEKTSPTAAALLEWANCLIALGRDDEAAVQLAAAWERNPADTASLMRAAALLVWFDRGPEYDALCRKALDLARTSNDPMTLERTAKICCLRAAADPARHDAALELATKAVTLGERHMYLAFFKLARGMAEYRAGRYADAEATLAAIANPHAASPLLLVSSIYQAMALAKLDRAKEARELMSVIAKKAPGPPAGDRSTQARDRNSDALIYWLAWQEAQTLIGHETREQAPPPRPAGR